MLFWKSSFAPRTSAEKFEKEYAYNIRHSYGKEGRRKDYEAQKCSQIISATPGVGEANGCPFKTFDKDALKVTLGRTGLPNGCVPCPLGLQTAAAAYGISHNFFHSSEANSPLLLLPSARG